MKINNGIVQLSDDTMDYIRFGSGQKTLILLPGLGDGLKTVRGCALPMALMYRTFARDYTVYLFSRRNHLPQDASTRSMAQDLHAALERLGIEKADLVGVSMGGMIAQHFAADYPQNVGKLVLVVTCAEPNPILNEAIQEWLAMAERGDHTSLMASNMRRMYSARYYRSNRWMIPLVGRLTRPKTYDRFFIQAQACLQHNATEQLGRISCPTLIIGGEKDYALGAQASYQMAEAIPRASLKMYAEWGHALYEEAKDFQQVVLAFLKA